MKKADHSVYIFLPAAGLHSANGGTWGVPSRAILEIKNSGAEQSATAKNIRTARRSQGGKEFLP